MITSLENEKTIKYGLKAKEENAHLNTLNEDEQLVLFAKLIIDIYLDQQYEKE